MSKPDGSQKSPTCTTCGQPLPEPVYVGPGDTVTGFGEKWTIIGEVNGAIWAFRQATLVPCVMWPLTKYRKFDGETCKGRPIAGFKDPRDEHIDKLQQDIDEREAQLVRWKQTARNSAEDITALVVEKLNHKCPANPLAGLSDEQLTLLAREFARHCGYDPEAHVGGDMASLLRHLRDGKLEVPR